MIKKFMNSFNGLETLAKKIMKNGLLFCLFLCVISVFVLITYDFILTAPLLYSIGIILLKLSFIFGTEFIICGFIADKIKKQLT